MSSVEMLVVYNGNLRTQQHLLRQVRRLCYGDALTVPGLRLEYRKTLYVSPHYLLVRHRKPVGVQYIEQKYWLDEIQQKLAVYLSVLGCTKQNTQFRAGGAHTAQGFNPRNLPNLFLFEAWHKADEEDEDFSAQTTTDLILSFSDS